MGRSEGSLETVAAALFGEKGAARQIESAPR
jgi:hypothetical protein